MNEFILIALVWFFFGFLAWGIHTFNYWRKGLSIDMKEEIWPLIWITCGGLITFFIWLEVISSHRRQKTLREIAELHAELEKIKGDGK